MCQNLDVLLDTENTVVSHTVFVTALKADSPLNSTASFFFLKTFLRAVLGLQQNWEGDTEISHIPLP